MGGKNKAPPAPPPPAEPAFDPAAIMGPMMASMQQMMSAFNQQQQQMFQFMANSTPPPPDPSSFFQDSFDLEAQREAIQQQLANNPTRSEQVQRGATGTVRVSPLEDEDEIDILNISPRKKNG